MTNEDKALLDMLAYAEETLGVSQNGYDVLVGNKRIIPGWTVNTDIAHRGNLWKTGNPSSAAGRYQFLYNTWLFANGGQNVPMTKANQNKAGLFLLNNRLGNIDKTALTDREKFNIAMDKLAPEWDSIPLNFGHTDKQGRYHQAGRSYSGKGTTKPTDDLYNIFLKALDIYKNK